MACWPAGVASLQRGTSGRGRLHPMQGIQQQDFRKGCPGMSKYSDSGNGAHRLCPGKVRCVSFEISASTSGGSVWSAGQERARGGGGTYVAGECSANSTSAQSLLHSASPGASAFSLSKIGRGRGIRAFCCSSSAYLEEQVVILPHGRRAALCSQSVQLAEPKLGPHLGAQQGNEKGGGGVWAGKSAVSERPCTVTCVRCCCQEHGAAGGHRWRAAGIPGASPSAHTLTGTSWKTVLPTCRSTTACRSPPSRSAANSGGSPPSVPVPATLPTTSNT